MNLTTLLPGLVAVVAAITALIISTMMLIITKKFGQGILASGFRKIALGVVLVGIGIVIEVAEAYLIAGNGGVVQSASIIKYVCFIAGTIIIYRGSKRTSDQLESLTKK